MGDRWGIVVQFLFMLCLMSQCLSSIVETAQGSDSFIAFLIGHSYGVELFPHVGFKTMGGNCSIAAPGHPCVKLTDPFDDSIVFSLGYVLIAVLIIPMCFMNLDENIRFQWASFGATIVFITFFSVYWATDVHPKRVPMIGDSFGEAVSGN
jgi:hypothetical protein